MHSCENDRGAPGARHVNWSEIAAAARDIDFDGPFVIESFASEVKAMAPATCVWRPLATSPDALASDGVTFLRLQDPQHARRARHCGSRDFRIFATTVKCGSTTLAISYSIAWPIRSEPPRSENL
jgi:hypothetical protein